MFNMHFITFFIFANKNKICPSIEGPANFIIQIFCFLLDSPKKLLLILSQVFVYKETLHVLSWKLVNVFGFKSACINLVEFVSTDESYNDRRVLNFWCAVSCSIHAFFLGGGESEAVSDRSVVFVDVYVQIFN